MSLTSECTAADRRARSLADELYIHGDRPALIGAHVPGGSLSYLELAGRVDDFASRLGLVRRLVLVEALNSVETVVAYLGAIAGRHPVMLAEARTLDDLADRYEPDVVVRDGALCEVRPGTAHDLHPDLALLLSTSGSTGSPKLVRLSHDNLVANADAIGDVLELRPDDIAATTLPIHYCYGLSVVNSHLRTGAAVLLNDRSVLEPEFWREFADRRATSFAGVPHTFDLLDRSGFEHRDLPSLRYVTQAGGRLAPEIVRRHAELGRRRGYDLVVMYGQTEATARMAYLPPDLAVHAPSAIGVPIPGGSFRLELFEGADDGIGELVYTGPNVMLGYAESARELGLGRTVDRLPTGDLGRLRSDGLLEITGRCNRIAKVFGVRVGLDRVEAVLAERGLTAAAADGGDRLVIAVCDRAGPVDPAAVKTAVDDALGVPAAGQLVIVRPGLPRLSSGKFDYAAISRLAEDLPAATQCGSRPADLVALYTELLGRPDAQGSDSFVSLGGDSLSYVEVSLRLEGLLGELPPDWHTRAIDDLADRPSHSHRGTQVETNVLLRAVAIVSIVGTHANLFTMFGGAHLLLAIAGFNFGRFRVTEGASTDRVIAVLRSVGRIVLPSVVVIGTVSLFVAGLGWRHVLLVNGLTTGTWTEPGWHYWFIEALVHTLLLIGLLLAIPPVGRLVRRFPFGFPFALGVFGLLTRYGVVDFGGIDQIHRAHVIFWLFALGWAAATATGLHHRLLLTLVVAGSVPGFFQDPGRDTYVILGMVILVWFPLVRVPAAAARAVACLAGASLWIYLVHWQVYPQLENDIPWLATALSLAAGILASQLWCRTLSVVTRTRYALARTSARRSPR